MKAIIFASILVAVTNPATAKPAWEISAKWFCRAERLISCDAQGSCQSGASRISALVDFEAGIQTNIGLTASRPARILRTETLAEVSIFSTYRGGVQTIRPAVRNSGTEYDYKLVIFGGDPLIHFGTCNPTQ